MNIPPPKFLVKWLVTRAKRSPIESILGSDGSLYMERYTLFKRDYLWVRLHITHRSDEGAHLHDHPWRNLSWILDAGYVEEMEHETICRIPGDIIYRGLDARHRLDLYAYDDELTIPCTSLFITGKWQQVWGFYKNGVKIPWREYLTEHNSRALLMKQQRRRKVVDISSRREH